MASTLFRYIFPFVVVVGALLWISRTYVVLSPTTVVAPNVLVASPVEVATNNTEIVGTVRIDGQDKGVRIPFLFFTNEKGTTIAKQLIFADTRGCSALAGDLPCAGVRDYGAYPDLSNNTHVVVTGYIVDDRFFVNKLRIL